MRKPQNRTLEKISILEASIATTFRSFLVQEYNVRLKSFKEIQESLKVQHGVRISEGCLRSFYFDHVDTPRTRQQASIVRFSLTNYCG